MGDCASPDPSGFRTMGELRGTALSRLRFAKALARLGRDAAETVAEFAGLRHELERLGPRHTLDMIDRAAAELGWDRCRRAAECRFPPEKGTATTFATAPVAAVRASRAPITLARCRAWCVRSRPVNVPAAQGPSCRPCTPGRRWVPRSAACSI
ncbi:hypothetical protein NKH18_02890 [Streptomyces sp. M10(2022)]